MRSVFAHRAVVPVFLGICITVLAASPAYAQDGYARQTHVEPGKPSIDIYVLGSTNARGAWRVTADISFVELIAKLLPDGLGAVPAGTIRKSKLDIYRSGPSGRQIVYSQDLREVLRGEAPAPTLQHHDLLVFENIERRKRFTFQTFSSVLGTSTSLILLYLRLSRGR